MPLARVVVAVAVEGAPAGPEAVARMSLIRARPAQVAFKAQVPQFREEAVARHTRLARTQMILPFLCPSFQAGKCSLGGR